MPYTILLFNRKINNVKRKTLTNYTDRVLFYDLSYRRYGRRYDCMRNIREGKEEQRETYQIVEQARKRTTIRGCRISQSR